MKALKHCWIQCCYNILPIVQNWVKRQPITLAGLIVIALICWLQVVSHSEEAGLLQRLNYLLYDIRLRTLLPYQPQSISTHKVVIVDIDESSLKEQGRWPWSRQKMTALVKNLEAAGVSVIGFDIVFAEPELNPAEVIAKSTADLDLKSKLGVIRRTFDYDHLFSKTLEHSKTDIVSGFFFHDTISIKSGKLPSVVSFLDPKMLDRTLIPRMIGFEGNLDAIQAGADSSGFVSVYPDSDGVIRRAPLLLRFEDKLYSSLGLEVAKAYRLANAIRVETYPEGALEKLAAIKLDDLVLHTDAKGQMLIPYRGGRGYFSYISASDVIESRADQSLLQNAIVLVGSSAIGLADLKPTPLSASFPGIESQASIVDGILRGDLPTSPDWGLGVLLCILVASGLFLMLTLSRVGPLMAVVITAITFLGNIGLNFYFWYAFLFDLALASVVIEIGLISTLYIVYGFYKETLQRRQIKSMFGQYVAPAHIDNLLGSPDSLSFEGETKEMTVLFADIRSFTNISEKLTAAELKQMLNRFFTPMTEIIFAHQGVIDKYVGDMIMAFWGAPLDDEKQCQHAVHASLKMLEKVEALKPEFAALGLPEISIGIGLNTGLMNVGDMGSTFRRAYTVLGDAVNLGSRLESLTKFYGVKCLVSEATIQQVEGVVFRLVDYIQVKGKEDAIKIYEPLGFQTAITPEKEAHLKAYHDARELYLNRQWAESKACFERLSETDPSGQILYGIYLDRIDAFMQTPPNEDWQGIFRHINK